MRTTTYPVMKSRILTLLMFVSFAFSAFAYDFEVGDFQYNIINLSDRTAEIVGTTNNECEQVNIPSEVIFNGIGIHVISIGQKVFSENKNLKEVVVGDGIRKIDYSFYNCKNLSKVELGTYTDTLIRAFDNCYNLREVTFKSESCYVSSAFYGCRSLSIVNIPSISTWCSYRFNYWPFSGLEKDIYLYIQGQPVVSVTVPYGLTHIGNRQFAGIRTIKEINLPQTVRVIGKSAFAETGIKEISIPEGCDSIMDYAFEGLKLEKLIIPASVQYLGNLRTATRKLIFEETTDTITIDNDGADRKNNNEYREAEYMQGVREVQLKRPIKGLLAITGYYKTNRQNSYEKTAHYGVNSSAFYGNETLRKIVIGKYFNKELHANTFVNCRYLDSLIIEDADEPIIFFQSCIYMIEKKDNPDYYDIKPYYRSEFGDSPLEYVYVGRNIIYKEIDVEYYWQYKYTGKRPSPFASKTVKEIFIGDNVETLPDKNLFKDCPIETICIGKRLDEIPEGTFSHTENSLKTITLHNETPPTYISGFSNYDYVNCKLFVPRSAMDSYKLSEPWGKFWNINDLETTGIDNIKTEKDLSKNHIYSINGTKVIAPSKGIYIINGKKIIYK